MHVVSRKMYIVVPNKFGGQLVVLLLGSGDSRPEAGSAHADRSPVRGARSVAHHYRTQGSLFSHLQLELRPETIFWRCSGGRRCVEEHDRSAASLRRVPSNQSAELHCVRAHQYVQRLVLYEIRGSVGQ